MNYERRTLPLTETAQYMVTREVAELVGVAERTILAWVADGKIPIVVHGRPCVFSRAAIRLWMAERNKTILIGAYAWK